MSEQQLVKDAYPDVIKALFITFVDNWTAAKGANNAPEVADAERAYSKGLQLRKDALAKALSLTPQRKSTAARSWAMSNGFSQMTCTPNSS
jgi:hypothetical protein